MGLQPICIIPATKNTPSSIAMSFRTAISSLSTAHLMRQNAAALKCVTWKACAGSGRSARAGFPGHALLDAAECCGFEVRDLESLREHYALTLRHWVKRLENRLPEAVAITDETTCRIWRLYMAGSAFNFDQGRLNVYQALLVKPDQGKSRQPLTRAD